MVEAAHSIKNNFGIRDLIIISIILHLLVINFPSDGRLVGDEEFYVPAARDILNGIPSNLQHPFLGKMWGSIGISIIGDNWLGWRLPIVVFGVLTLLVFYHFSKFFLNKQGALVATAFLSFDTIFFIHSSLLLIDVPPLFFAILGFYLYQKTRYSFAALSFGVAILCKEWALLFILTLLVYHIILSRNKLQVNKCVLIKTSKFFAIFLTVVIIPLWVYTIFYQPFSPERYTPDVFTQEDEENNFARVIIIQNISEDKKNNPLQYISYILNFHSNIPEKHITEKNFWNNYPWGWIIPYDVKPLIYFETFAIAEKQPQPNNDIIIITEQKHPISWKGIGNFPIWLSIWIILPFVSYRVIKRKAENLDYLIICWISFTFFSWFYFSIIMDKIVYAFYFINVVPILAISIPHFLENISKARSSIRNVITAIWIGTAIIFFLYYFPVDISLI